LGGGIRERNWGEEFGRGSEERKSEEELGTGVWGEGLRR
jgi:hypothetical protein